METEIEKIISDQVKKLPPEVRDALGSEQLHTNIVKIGEKYHLHIDQMGTLEDEVTLIMMGLSNPADFPGELEKQLSIPAAEAESLAGEISDQIFLPIRDAMKKFTEQESPSVVMPSAGAPTPTSAPKPAALAPIVNTPSKPVVPPTPTVKLDTHAADLMLSQPTVSMPSKIISPTPAAASKPASTPAPAAAPSTTVKAEIPKPPPYKADPYREPVE